MKGKKCGKGYIPRARKCLSGLQKTPGQSLPNMGSGLDKGGIAKNAAIGLVAGAAIGTAAIATKKEVGTQFIGLIKAGPKWTPEESTWKAVDE